jgi:hypothetical protein
MSNSNSLPFREAGSLISFTAALHREYTRRDDWHGSLRGCAFSWPGTARTETRSAADTGTVCEAVRENQQERRGCCPTDHALRADQAETGNSPSQTDQLMEKRAQRIPSWPGVIHSNKGRVHLRRPTCGIFTISLAARRPIHSGYATDQELFQAGLRRNIAYSHPCPHVSVVRSRRITRNAILRGGTI